MGGLDKGIIALVGSTFAAMALEIVIIIVTDAVFPQIGDLMPNGTGSPFDNIGMLIIIIGAMHLIPIAIFVNGVRYFYLNAIKKQRVDWEQTYG